MRNRTGERTALTRPALGRAGEITLDFLWTGLAAGIWYTAVVLIGALATPGYSHIGERVSTLYQSGPPNGPWIAALFAVHNLLILACRVGVLRLASQLGAARWRLGQAGGVARHDVIDGQV